MAGLFTILFKLFMLYNLCSSKTISNYDRDYSYPQDYADSNSQDYVLADNYGFTDVQWLRFGGNYDEDAEWNAYGESSGK